MKKVITNHLFSISLSMRRDKTEELKKLTPAERQELKNQEYAQNSSNSDAFTFSRFSQRRRERALKIYVDSSPKKYDD